MPFLLGNSISKCSKNYDKLHSACMRRYDHVICVVKFLAGIIKVLFKLLSQINDLYCCFPTISKLTTVTDRIIFIIYLECGQLLIVEVHVSYKTQILTVNQQRKFGEDVSESADG